MLHIRIADISNIVLVRIWETPTLGSISIHKHSAIMGNAEIIVPHLIVKDILLVEAMWIDGRNGAACNEPGP